MGLYAIRVIGQPYVKIGITDGDPVKRLSMLQVGCPLELAIYGFDPRLGRSDEEALHRDFLEYSVRGEWFRIEGRVQAWLHVFGVCNSDWQRPKPKRTPMSRDKMDSIRAIMDRNRARGGRVQAPYVGAEPSGTKIEPDQADTCGQE